MRIPSFPRLAAAAALTSVAVLASPGAPVRAASDPSAVALAESTLVAMGGAEAWERTRCLRWRFMGKRLHHWDRWSGDVRIEADERLVLMNIHTGQGRVWDDGVEVTDQDTLRTALEQGYARWVNDSYWLIMPYKLLDPGVRLTGGGTSSLPDGRPAHVITVSFGEKVGLTPQNRYEVWIADDTGLVEQWAYYTDADDPEPRFVGPWAGWETFGEIRLPTSRGRGLDWDVAVFDSLPAEVFEVP